MIRVFADSFLAYDSRLPSHDLVGLEVTNGLNVGGTAEIAMPAGHPAYNAFVSYKTVVTIYRDGELRFRGRALYSAESFYGERTITCEGELCFLRDGISRPESYNSTPARIFRALINAYNAQVDSFKQFTLGTVDIPDETISLRVDNAETVLTTVNKLLQACGGYIVFTDAEDGTRAINWLTTVGQHSEQVIEFGENLLDFSSTGANTTSLATGIIPYGGRDESTKKRVTIESVNDGKDYIIAEDAKAIRGIIMTTATWDDVTEPAELLKKAQAFLEESKVFITSLELTALDLSYLDKAIDSFSAGDTIRVISAPHGVNEDFQLTQLTEDLLRPERSKVALGKNIQSLTGADVRAAFENQNSLSGYVRRGDLAGYATTEQLTEETTARKSLIDLLWSALYVGGGAQETYVNGLKLHLGDAAHPTDINGTEINFSKEARFPNESGIRIADKDGNFYYVLRVDTNNNCFLGNDYCNLYLRAKDAVYLHKTGAVVTSDRREKDSIEELPEAYMTMLDRLTPVRFKYKNRGDRYHVGFIAQDVEQAMTEADLDPDSFGGFVDLNGDGSQLGLAYDEFIGLLLQKIRRLEKRLEKLEG